MATVTDSLQLVFQTSGIGSVLSAYKSLQNANDRLQQAQVKMAAAMLGTQKQQQAAFQNLQNAMAGVETAELAVAQTGIQAGIQLVKAAYGAVQAWTSLSRTILDVQDLTGATAERAAGLVAEFRAAGLSSAQEIRDLAELSKSVFTPQGRSALSFLGISADPTQDPIKLMNTVADALQRVHDPLRRNQLEITLFSQRGLAAMQSFLRLSKETRDELERRGGVITQDELDRSEQFYESIEKLKAAFDFQFVRHIAEDITPFFATMIDYAKNLIDLFDGLNSLVDRFLPLFKQLQISSIGILGPLSGFMAPINAAIGAFNRWAGFSKSEPNTQATTAGPVDKFSASVDKFEASINQMTDWGKWAREGGIPKGLVGDTTAISAITRQMALGAIG